MLQQTKRKKFPVTVAIIGIIVACVSVVYFVPTQTSLSIIPTTPEDQERNNALGMAQKFIITSPTFAFDGNINTLDTEYVGSTKSIPSQYMIKISFDSAHGGYGNREGQMLTQVITPHKMEIIISEGNVISAVTDEVWDELNNQFVLKNPQSKLPSNGESVLPFEGMVSDYSTLIQAIQSRGILVEQIDQISSESSSFSVPTKVLSVGGSDVQVFQFQKESDAKTSNLIVSKDGTEIGPSIIRWVDTPHFYTNGNLIVLYVGHNPEIMNLLESLLGIQFAGM